MTTPLELSRKVAAYLERTCPPPGAMRWQDYLTGDGEADMPVLCAAATALRITVRQLYERAEAAAKVKRVSARYVRKVEVTT